MTSGVRRRLLLLAALVVLAGCGGSKTQATPAGFTVRTVAQPSFSIALPKGWRSFDSRSSRAANEPGGRTLHLSYRTRSNAVVHQYFVKHDELLYVLTYTTAPAESAHYAKIFDMSAHTFQVG